MSENDYSSSTGSRGSRDSRVPLSREEDDGAPVIPPPPHTTSYSPSAALGGLPTFPTEVKPVTSDTGSGVARSMGGISVGPAPSLGMATFGPPSLAPPALRATSKPALVPPAGGSSKASVRSPPRSVASASPASSDIWKVTDESLPTLPEFHPLERSAEFAPHTPAPIVAGRVVECLRVRSIAASFDDEKAKIKCTSADGAVDFRVRLYRGRNKCSHGVICEVQRRFGFSMFYQSDVQAILDAAVGKKIEEPEQPPNLGFLVPPSLNSGNDNDDEWGAVPPPIPSLSLAGSMLQRSEDSKKNAMDLLATMTDPNKMGPEMAVQASKSILSPQNNQVRNTIVDIAMAPPSLASCSDFSDSDDASSLGGYVPEDSGLMKIRAMETLSNAVTATADSALSGAIPDISTKLMPTLVKNLSCSSKDLVLGDASARCLHSFLRSSDSPDVLGPRDEAIKNLKKARDLGLERHSRLAKSANDCIGILSR